MVTGTTRHGHRVLFFVEPMPIRTGPTAFALAARQFARLAERLARIPRVHTAMVCHHTLTEPLRGVAWLSPGAHGMPAVRPGDWRERWAEQLHGHLQDDWRAFYEQVLEAFAPTVVYIWNTNPAFEALCRERQLPLLYVELGGIRTVSGSRMSVDPLGFGAGSALATSVLPVSDDMAAEWGWRWAAEHVLDEAQDLRPVADRQPGARAPHVVLPLQYEDDVNWLLHPTFRDSVHFVDEVVPRLLDGGVERVTIRVHPWHRSTAVLARLQRWPGVTVDVGRRSLLGALHEVDALVTLNSTTGLEALACGVPVLALSPCSYPVVYASDGLAAIDAFVERVRAGTWWDDERLRTVGGHVYRLVAHYSLPQDVYADSSAHLDLLDEWHQAGASGAWFSDLPARLHALATRRADALLRKRTWALRQQEHATSDRLADLHVRTAQSFGDAETARRLGLARWWSGADVPHEDLLAIARTLPRGEATSTAAFLHAELLEAQPSAERMYHLASALERSGAAEAATELFSRLASDGDGRIRPGALYHLGTLARARGALHEAARPLHACLEEVPGHQGAMDALQATLRALAVDGWTRVGNCEWREIGRSSLAEALYGASATGEKRYEVRFDTGRALIVTQTRERSYADVRGATELSRYRLLTPFLEPGWRVLDCASGTGYGADWLARQGARVTGAELDPTAVTFARYRYPPARFVRVSAPDLPFATGSFDALTCVETLEHFAAHDAFIGEVARVLRPGGVLLLTTPRAGTHDSPFHVRERSWPELVALLGPWFGPPQTWVRPHREECGFGFEIIARRIAGA